MIAITFSCIDSIDCSPFSRNEPGENLVKLHLHNWNMQFEIWYNIFDKCSHFLWCTVIFIDLSQICVVESWTASRQLLGNFISTIAFVYEGDLFIRSIACIACNHKLPHIESWKASQRPIKASLDSDNRVRRLWREFIYWAHHSHGLLSQASSRFKSSVAYTRNLFLALVHSTMTRNHCAEPSYAWLVAIGCLISRAGKPQGRLV